jgi:hypothetical protein
MVSNVKWVLFAVFLIAIITVNSDAATYTAASCSQGDVQAAVNQAATGDTVLIPASSCPSGVTWGKNTTSDTPLSITVGLTLNGQGVTITDNEMKGDSNCQHTTSLISVVESSNVAVRITGLNIVGVAPSYNCGESANHIWITGTQQFRVDHNTFNPAVTVFATGGYPGGVFDHNTVNYANFAVFGVQVKGDSFQAVGSWGDNSWAQADSMGMPGTIANPGSTVNGVVYIENNTFSATPTSTYPTGCFDSEFGGRLVFRFNTGCSFVGVHGMDSSGRARSVRHYEIYDNTFTSQYNSVSGATQGQAVFLRGGTGMLFNNNFNDGSTSSYSGEMIITSYRDTDEYIPWAGPAGQNGSGNWGQNSCDGNSPYDSNDGGGNRSTSYASGSASPSSSTDNLVASSSPGWTTNQWVGYSVRNTTASTPWGAIIIANTSNTITTAPLKQLNGPHTWSSGDSFLIMHAYPCLDQIGRGAGTLIQDSTATGPGGICYQNNGYCPVVASTGLQGPAEEASDPLYEWLNTHNTSTYLALNNNSCYGPNCALGHLAPNRDYYDYTSSFNGTSGVGSGTLASRPSSCTIGVGYWATDQGNWNQSGSGGQGELFVCTATNTWSLYYTPYAYPHPLVQQGTSLAPPTNVTAVGH